MTNVNAVEVMDQLFKFKIGDFVARRDVYESWKAELAIAGPTLLRASGKRASWDNQARVMTVYQITERHMQQCYGGVQLHYQFHADNNRHELITVRLSEPELVPKSEVDALMSEFYVKSDDA